jgi:hypothetical protein
MLFFAVNWRVWVVIGLVFLFALARRLYKQWRDRLAADQGAVPPLPQRLRNGKGRTWVVFGTPLCASCGPLAEELSQADPGGHVVRVDATRETELASAYRIRSAPTVLLADGRGRVQGRFVGAGAVREHLATVAGRAASG